jgi:hypothetical protein
VAARGGWRRSVLRNVADATRVIISGVALARLGANGLEQALNPLVAATVAWGVRPLRAAPAMDALFVVLLTVDSLLVTTGAMERIDRQDTFGHLVLSAAIAPIVLAAGESTGRLNRLAVRGPVALTAALVATILLLGVVWEAFELLADSVIGSDMSLGRADTIHDLVCDAVGATIGSILTVAYWERARDSRPRA